MVRLGFILRRLGKAVVVVFAIVVLNFLLIRLVPGDPALVMAGEAGAADQKYLDDLRHEFGLDKPLWVQLALYVGHVAEGDLGYSYRQRVPVDATDRRAAAADTAADRHRHGARAGSRHFVRSAGGPAGGLARRQRHHRGGDGGVRDALVLDRADGGTAVLAPARLAAAVRHDDGRRQLHGPRGWLATSPRISFCPPPRWVFSSSPSTRA